MWIRSALWMLCLAPGWSMAGELDGAWKFDTATQFKVDFKAPEPMVKTIIFQGLGTNLEGNCRINIRRTEFAFHKTFQSLYKMGLTEVQLQQFLKKNFNFTLANKTHIYQAVGTAPTCASPLREFFIEGDQLLVPFGGNFFYRYLKTPAPRAAGATVGAELAALKPTRLPFSLDAYYAKCSSKVMVKNGSLKGADQCQPSYNPYVASPASASALHKLIGNHDFHKTGGEYAFDYGPPFKFRRTPTFIVLPPRNGVYVLHVDDLEPINNEERDRFAGAFISIKDDIIVDQLDRGCTFDADYVCTDSDGVRQGRLTNSGKFVDKLAQ